MGLLQLAGMGASSAPAAVSFRPPRIGPLEVLGHHENPMAPGGSFLDARIGADGRFPVQHYLSARRQAAFQLRRLRAGVALGQVAPGAFERSWTFLGPSNVGGRARGILIDPRDPNRMFVGGVAGGVWRSTDAGATWSPLTDTYGNVAVAALAMDPANPDVMYVGTGELLSSGNQWASTGIGILKTGDGGRSFRLLPSTAAFGQVTDIMISSNDSKVLYVGTDQGVQRSSDGGETWQLVFQGNDGDGCQDLAIRTDMNPDVVFASCSLFLSLGVFRSVDGGTTWENVIGEVNGQPSGYAALAIAPSNQNVMYASVSEPFGGGTRGSLALLRSDQGGAAGTWNVQNSGGGGQGSPGWLNYCGDKGGQGYYGNAIAVDPTNPDRFWVAGVDTYRSEDGGRTMIIGGYWYPHQEEGADDGSSYIHADHHGIVFHPNYDGAGNQTVYFATDGGIFRTQNDRAALNNPACQTAQYNDVKFDSLNEGFAVSQFYGGDVTPDGSIVIGGTQDNGTYALESGGPESWRLVFGGDGFYAAITPAKDRFYAEYANGELERSPALDLAQFRTVTGQIPEQGLFATPFRVDYDRPQTVWIGMQSLWRTDDTGDLWFKASPAFESQRGISSIAIAPGHSDVVYAGTDTGKVYVSTNATQKPPNWTDVSGPLPAGQVAAIAVDPADAATAYAVFSTFGVSHVWKTTDTGATWTDLQGDLPDVPFNGVAVNPLNPRMVYVGTDSGIYESPNGGVTWLPANGALTSTIVMELKFRQGTSELFAFTHGRGVYKVDVGTG
jgi:photosystem II stability/assembly factor-like uncharacterized protein